MRSDISFDTIGTRRMNEARYIYIYKWMQLLVDTSSVHAVLYTQGMLQSSVRERSGAPVLYIFLIALSCARLPIEPARVYLIMFFVLVFWVLF